MYPLLVTSNEVYGELGHDFNSSAAVLGTAACSVVSLTSTGIVCVHMREYAVGSQHDTEELLVKKIKDEFGRLLRTNLKTGM